MIIYSTPELREAASKAGWNQPFVTCDLVVGGGLALWKTESLETRFEADGHQLIEMIGWGLVGYPALLEYIEEHYPEALL